MPGKEKRRKHLQLESPTACVFCGKDENNEFLYGKFFHGKTLSVHQHCLFFASGLSQRGRRESEGISGFLICDIQKEVLRGKKLGCFHCKINGATIGCCKPACRRTFHFPCGIENQTLHQSFGSFSSFCQLHRPVQKSIKTPAEELYCHICFLSLSKKDISNCLYSTCCNPNLFHKTCLQKYALSAGRHFFKCPMCNNSCDFLKEMEFYGICVPEKDASWELEEDAYQDLLYRPECGADNCRCADGRKYNGKSDWILLPCCYCGADARHRSCADLNDEETTWKCNECETFEDQIVKKKAIPQSVSDEANSTDLISQQVPSSELQLVNFEPSCSNICSIDVPPPIAKTKNFQTDNVTSLSTSTHEDDEAKLCKDVSPAVVSPRKVPPVRKNTVESKARKGANSKSLKRGNVLPETNLNKKKMRFMDDILNQIKAEKIQNKSNFILNCSSIKMNASARQSKGILKKRKADKKITTGCCSGNSQQCIKKMFGLQCHNYRI